MQPVKSHQINRNSDRDHCTPSKARRCLTDSTPRTPTPFKNALAELEKNGGIVKYMVQWSFVLLIWACQYLLLQMGTIQTFKQRPHLRNGDVW
jgi:hypothetical protein